MKDRIWGIDISDHQLMMETSDKLWEKHKEELIIN
jgi:hypothetical protein